MTKFTNDTLSIIVRYHRGADIELLNEALFSIGCQTYDDIQIIVATQNCNSRIQKSIVNEIERLPLTGASNRDVQHGLRGPKGAISHRLINLNGSKSNDDLRGKLLNQGIRAANGRYIAFLDYDDVLYQYFASELIECLTGNSAIAIGGCMRADVKISCQHYRAVYRKELWRKGRRNILNLIYDNFIPIHSFIVDRQVVDEKDLKFKSLPALEDYDLLLRLAAKYEFDFQKLSLPVSEYRHRSDGSNVTAQLENPLTARNWIAGRGAISRLKKQLSFNRPLEEMSKLIAELVHNAVL